MEMFGNRDLQLSLWSAWKEFTNGEFTISSGSLFKNMTTRIIKVHLLVTRAVLSEPTTMVSCD